MLATLRAAGIGLFALAAAALAQPAADRERQILDTITREQAENGRLSNDLIAPLSDLAGLYRDRGDDALAAAVMQQLLEVIRANDGVLSLDQVPFIEQLIAIEESRGEAAAAWDLEQRLLTLAKRNPGDLRTVPIFRNAAQKRFELFQRYWAGEDPPQVEIGCYSGWPRSRSGDFADVEAKLCKSGARSETARAIVTDAQRYYAEAIALLVDERQYASPELRDLETELLGTIMYPGRVDKLNSLRGLDGVRTDIEPWRSWAAALGGLSRVTVPNPTGLPLVPSAPPAPPHGEFEYLFGRESQVRLFAYELASAAPLSQQIEAFLRIADWDLLYSQNARALNEYAQVYRLLEDRGAGSSIDALFSPEIPVTLPAYLPNPLLTAPTDDYIDVTFEVTQLGESRKMEMTGSSAGVTAADRDALMLLLKSSRFRPRSQDGKPARAAAVAVRYYVGG